MYSEANTITIWWFIRSKSVHSRFSNLKQAQRIRTYLEKSLNLTSWSWKLLEFEKSAFCPGIVLEVCKIILENMNVLEKFVIQLVLSDLWDVQKTVWKSQKTEWKSLDTHEEWGVTCILFYSICAVVLVFITGIRIKENECAVSLWRFRLINVHFWCFIPNLEEI